jgi:acyl-coenzyme A synthetase/AMP-(fatty) acid ligase
VGQSAPTSADWHRTGDIARVDARGRLWLLGRVGDAVVHRGRVVHPYVVEAAALAFREVRAAGLVAHAEAPEGELAVSLVDGADERAVVATLRGRLDALDLAALPVRVLPHIPMDARHGSKVARRELAGMLTWRAR